MKKSRESGVQKSGVQSSEVGVQKSGVGSQMNEVGSPKLQEPESNGIRI